MRGKQVKIRPYTSPVQPNNISHTNKQLTQLAKNIITDVKKNDIEKVLISSGGARRLSKTIERDKIIVTVPSSAQSSFLKNYLNKAYSSENPLQIELTASRRSISKSSHKAMYNRMKKATDDDGEGIGGRHGKKPLGVR